MAPARTLPADKKTDINWDNNFQTHRRLKLFKAPPRDHTAYPSLTDAVEPHIKSFNAITERGGILDLGLQDIGIKEFLDGDTNVNAAEDAGNASDNNQSAAPQTSGSRPAARNKLSVRIKDVMIEKPRLPVNNKHALDREITPAEARERYCSYKAKLRARVEWRINSGDWKNTIRELGQVPIMLCVGE